MTKAARKPHERKTPEDRKKELEGVLLGMFRSGNIAHINCNTLGAKAGVSRTLAYHYFGDTAAIRAHAVKLACDALTPADVAACKRAIEGGDIKRLHLNKKMQVATK